MNKIKVLLISSVRPEPTTAGNIILYRHLAENKFIEYDVYGNEPEKTSWRILDRRLFGFLSKTRFHRWANDYFVLRQGRWLDSYLPDWKKLRKNIVVITMAHGDACYAAMRYAKKSMLPLVTFYDDWYPDMIDCHTQFKKLLEYNFYKLYCESDVVFCVSQGMKDHLGPHSYAQVLNRIPGIYTQIKAACAKNLKYRVYYFGNLNDYGPMLKSLLEASFDNPNIFIQVRGRNPNWPDEFKKRMAESTHWLDYAPRQEFENWLSTADAFLIPMVFEAHYRRRMETSFPSKLTECVQYCKPIIIWGPSYCSAVHWAKNKNKALCVTDSDPNNLIKAVEKLASDSDEQRRLSQQSRTAASTEFNRDKIQEQFTHTLFELIERKYQDYNRRKKIEVSETLI